MKKNIYFLNVVLLIITAILACIYQLNGGIFLKGMTSCGFVLTGALNTYYLLRHTEADKRYALFTFSALFLSMLGDIILNIEFIIGAIIFACGHVCYVFAFKQRKTFSEKDLLYGTGIFLFSLLFLLFMPMLDFGSALMKIICIMYAFIISLMVGKAVSNVFSDKNKTNRIIASGSILFFISDIMLVLYVFGGASPLINTFCLLTYVPAQCIFALSVFSAANE